MSAGGCCAEVYSCIFDYNTPRIALIKSRKVGLLNRVIQLLILAYVIGWVFVWEKGYQEFDTVVSSVTSKVKGVAATNTSDLDFRIWDVADYIIPAQEENAFFVMTNLILTPNQTQRQCAELPDTSTICHSHRNCTPGYVGTHSNGVQTGRCVPYNESVKTCEVSAWCPVENDITVPKPAFLGAAENFTVLIKNNIWYPKFNFSKRNILQNISADYLKTCIYDREKHPFCPIFHLGRMVQEAGESFQEMAVLGGVMGIQISWNCDLDKKHTNCVPKYSFRRLDNRELDHNVSPGYNFRFAKYYKDSNNVESRTLMKIYGIRFDILVFGTKGNVTSTDLHCPIKEVEESRISINRKIVKKHLANINELSPGPDELHPRVLKEIAEEIFEPLSIIFENSWRTGEVPEDWRRANVVPIFKQGKKVDPGNYRPVSLTSIPGKNFEQIIKHNVRYVSTWIRMK
ncbi:P2X purinoceptor 4 isoform X1 [Ranitomeya variabilis]|uniref:P2X purinoceptor 4 isoform X1 n=1 Tax=Ranitomeya variabilis TaxID=490064 RepID=UPI004057BD2A